MSISLRTYFILIFSFFIILFTSVLGFTINEESSESVERQISESLTEEAFEMAEQLDAFMWSRYGEITVLSNLKVLQQPDNIEEIRHLLKELKANFPSFSWVGYTDATGNVTAATDDILVGSNIAERPVFKDAIEQTFIGDVHQALLLAELLPNPTGEPLKFVDISAPIYNEKNEFKGVLAAHLSWQWADEVRKTIIQPTQQMKENLEVFIISKKDNTILLGPKDMLGQPLHLESISKAQSGENHWALEKWPDGNLYLTGYALADGFLNYPGLDWTVLVRQPESIAFHSVDVLKDKIIKISVISFIVFGLMGWYFASIISTPLRRLAVTAERLKNGERVKIPIMKGISDVETLATSLRDLISTLTQTKFALGKMELKANLDNLTGLPNRLALDEFLKNMNNSLTNEEQHFTMLYIDLDGFKKVNDEYGHHHGDELLKEISNRLNNCIRSSEFLCRLGGDEFVIIIERNSHHNLNEIDIIGYRIIKSVNEPVHIEDSIVKVGCSIGVASWPYHDNDPQQVLRYADKALYLSKSKGKNQLTYFK